MVELTNADDCPLSDLDDTASTSSLEPESSDKFILKIGMISSDGTVKYDSFKTIDWSCSTQMSSPPLVDTSPSLAAKIQFVYHLEDTEEPYRIVFIDVDDQVVPFDAGNLTDTVKVMHYLRQVYGEDPILLYIQMTGA